MEFNTKLLHGSAVSRYADGATIPSIAQTTAFQYETAEEHESVFLGRKPGFAYTRVGNPTVSAFERRIAEMEGGSRAYACSSGMSAITLALLNMLSSGDEIIAGASLYGGTIDLFRDLRQFGIMTHFVQNMTEEEIAPLISERTKVLFGEVIGNPSLAVMDIRKIADLAHRNGIPLVVDSTTATPYLVNPIELGADLVVHSSSKYINGGGNSVSGVIVDAESFPWNFERFKALAPFKKFGHLAYGVRMATDTRENFGCCLAPFNAFLNVIGMETMGLRMDRICENARSLAESLAGFSKLQVRYLTLPDNPYRELAKRQLRGRGGGIFTFRAGSRQKAFDVMNHLHYAARASNIGDLRTLVIHPASTLYIRSTEEEREQAGVFEDTVRVSVGIEDIDDLIRDFTDAIKSCI